MAHVASVLGLVDDAAARTGARDDVLGELREAGLDGEGAPQVSGPMSLEDGERAIGELLGMDVTAVVCSTDILALGAIGGANKRGVRVPDGLAIMGIDNLAFSAFTRPPLASVGIPAPRLLRPVSRFCISWWRRQRRGGASRASVYPYDQYPLHQARISPAKTGAVG